MKSQFHWILLCIALFGAFLGIGEMDVVTDNEGQRATPPAEMIRSGDYLVPTINGEAYLVKPPLLYWAIAGLYTITGPTSEFGARVPTALCGVALALLVYFVARKEAGAAAARWASLAVVASPYVLERMRWAELDIPLTLATMLSILLARGASSADSIKRAGLLTIGSGVALGAAVMLKGPVPFLFLWAALVATLITSGPNADGVVRKLLPWTIAAFGLEVLLKTSAYFVPSAAKPLGTPVALIFVLLIWSVAAIRNGGAGTLRRCLPWIASIVIGVALCLPWALAVLAREGWPYVSAMLNNQVVERTYVASEINSGTPFYFLLSLPVMLAPWGFLLPLQASRKEWSAQPTFYRFCVVMGWLSVLVFSLIAGKEYEYILPCIPFLLIAAGCHLAKDPDLFAEAWVKTWLLWWQRIVLVLLAIGAAGGAVYVSIKSPVPGLLAAVWPLATIALAAGFAARGSRTYRTAIIFVMTLCVVLIGLMDRAYRYTGDRSPRALANQIGDLRRSGHAVEASKIYPAFAFYCGVIIPLEQNADQVRAKLESPEPYYYLTRPEWLALMSGAKYEVLIGPSEFRNLVLIGNAPLP